MDPFEQKLKRQEIKKIPAEWRQQMMSAAVDALKRSSVKNVNRANAEGTPNLQQLWRWLAASLWPSPRVWAALAVAWLAIILLNTVGSDPSGSVEPRSASAAPAMFNAIREQERLLAELAHSSDPERPQAGKPPPSGPRSQAQQNASAV